MPDNSIIASTVRPVDLQPQAFTLQLNGGTEAVVTAARPRPLDVLLEAHTISVGPSVETVVNIGAPRKVVSLLQFGTPGEDGADGEQLELRVTGDMLQWRLEGQVAWLDLVDLTTVVPGTLWGLIGGTLSNQTDLQNALNAKLDDAQATAFGLSLLDDADAATARATLNVDVAGTAATLDAAHVAAGDPHPQYLTAAEGNAAYSFLGHTHLLAALTDVTMTVANLNALDDGVNTALHFHDADRARANHTGTQLAATVSDFNEAAQDAVGGMVDATLVYVDGTPALGRAAITGHISIPAGSNAAVLGSFTMAQLDAAVSDGNVSYSTHTHLLAAGATDVTITAANLNALDDGVNTALHFHDADRARANHTGTQLAATVSDFNEAAQDAVGGMVDATLVYVDGTPALGRAAITGHISIPAGSNAAVLGSFTMAQLDAAVSDGNISYTTHTHAGLAPVGGTINQVLKKNSATDYDYSWAADATGGGGLSDGDYGDITVSAGATVFTIDNDVVSNAKAANMATATIKGRVTAATGDPEDLTGTQATTLLDVFTSGLKGLAPSSGGGTTNFLRADGTWAAPSGGGGGVSDGDKGDITISGTGTVYTIDNDVVTYAKLQNVAANSVLARAAATSGDASEVALAASQLLGRGASGDVAAITLGTNLSMSGATLNATGGGVIVKVASATSNTASSTSTAIPSDTTIPQNTEGAEVMTCAITPSHAANKLKIDVTVYGDAASYYGWAVALFKDSDASAIATAPQISFDYGSLPEHITFTHYRDAGSTSSQTFKVRAGPVNGTLWINQAVSGAATYGGTLISTIVITEIDPAGNAGGPVSGASMAEVRTEMAKFGVY